MTAPATRSVETVRDKLAEVGLRRALTAMIRRKVPPHEVDEIVQATLLDACASSTAPMDPEALERWIRGIARNKVADYHRHSRREEPVDTSQTLDDLASARVTDTSAHDAADLLRWAERENTDRERTLEWLLREGEGEKLQSIAEGEDVPAARVRQRVARLRKHFRARWAAQLAAALVVAVAALTMFELRHAAPFTPVTIASVTVPPKAISPLRFAHDLRDAGLTHCAKGEWTQCLDALDRAALLDPAGDATEVVKRARASAIEALNPLPPTAPSLVLPKRSPPPPPKLPINAFE